MLVYRSLRSFRRGSRFATWLYRVAVNKAVDAARAEKRRKWTPFDETLQQTEAVGADPAGSIEARSDQDAIQAVLREVPPNHRDVLVLRYFQDMSVSEIAEVLGCTETAAKVRLHRARAKFREKYEAMYGKLSL